MWHAVLPRLAAGAFALALASAAGGCSFSYQLDSLFGKSEDKAAEETSAVKQASVRSGPDMVAFIPTGLCAIVSQPMIPTRTNQTPLATRKNLVAQR